MPSESAVGQAYDTMVDPRVFVHMRDPVMTMSHLLHTARGFKLQPTHNTSCGKTSREKGLAPVVLVDNQLSDGRA